MMRIVLCMTGAFMILLGCLSTTSMAGSPLTKCTIQGQPQGSSPRLPDPKPECGIEITCTDQPVQIGYSDGVCFRATCPGIWALTHKRVDQASFRRRIWTYRHFAFKGYWELKDQGAIQSGPVELREMFLVLPDDLIELRLRDPDKFARVEIRNLGYVKRGDICELQKWLAQESYMEGPALIQAARNRANQENGQNANMPAWARSGMWLSNLGGGALSDFLSRCRSLGFPVPAPAH